MYVTGSGSAAESARRPVSPRLVSCRGGGDGCTRWDLARRRRVSAAHRRVGGRVLVHGWEAMNGDFKAYSGEFSQAWEPSGICFGEQARKFGLRKYGASVSGGGFGTTRPGAIMQSASSWEMGIWLASRGGFARTAGRSAMGLQGRKQGWVVH